MLVDKASGYRRGERGSLRKFVRKALGALPLLASPSRFSAAVDSTPSKNNLFLSFCLLVSLARTLSLFSPTPAADVKI